MPKCSLFVRDAAKQANVTKGDCKERTPMKDTEPHEKSDYSALHFDWQDWLPYLDDEDISEEQKYALIETLWSIVIAFVDLGWDIKSSPNNCGKALDLKAALEAAVVSSEETSNNEEAGHDR